MNEELLPGNYTGLCTGEVKYGRGEKGEQVALELQMPDGETYVWSILYFSPLARERSIAKLKACGWTGKGDIGSQVKEHPVRFQIKFEMYAKTPDAEPERKIKVDIFDGAGGFKIKNEMTDSERDNFIASLTGSGDARSYPAEWDGTGVEPKPPRFSLDK